MVHTNPVLAEKIRTLRFRFRKGLPDRVASITQTLAAVNAERVDDLTRQFHSLAGTAATYQFYEIAQLASEAETLCEEYAIGPSLFSVLTELEQVAMDIAATATLDGCRGEGARVHVD